MFVDGRQSHGWKRLPIAVGVLAWLQRLSTKVQLVWRWICSLLQIMSTQPTTRIRLTDGQALVGTPLVDSVSVLAKWWTSIQGASIWLARNTKTRQNKKVTCMETQVKIWYKMILYMKIEWSKYQNKIFQGSILEDQAKYLFRFDFGQNDLVYTITIQQLTFTQMPLEPE